MDGGSPLPSSQPVALLLRRGGPKYRDFLFIYGFIYGVAYGLVYGLIYMLALLLSAVWTTFVLSERTRLSGCLILTLVLFIGLLVEPIYGLERRSRNHAAS